MRYGKHLFIWVMALGMLSACVTHKKRDDVGKVAKMYHDMTSKYNRNFNANVLIDETFLGLDASYVEDYSEVLPLYPHVDKENPTALAEPMDQAIEKASVAISIHRPSHWTDDNYLIIARSQFIKEDFESAEATLRYLIKHYDPENLVKASSSKSRNVNSKMSDREKEAQRKELEKERVFKVKERQKQIRENKKERKKQKNARKDRIKERKNEIKEREKLAKQGKSQKSSSQSSSKKSDVASDEGKKKKNNEIPFDENPELPKVKGNPDNYFLKHKPAFQDAQLLLARTLIERDRFGEAENVLRRLENDERTFDEVRREVYVAQAHSALSRGQMAAATAPLILAIEHAKDRVKEARYSFILAQIYEKLNQYQQALDAYDLVDKLKPGYEMTFNATLSKLHMQWNTNNVSSDEFEKTLKKLVKDSKNIEYQDQLYYSLAMRELKLGNRKEAIAHLSSAAKFSVRNVAQKADAYYTIASLYYEDEDYIRAKYYFDSTAAVMPESDLRVSDVRNYAKNLTDIAANLEIVELQDSLIGISEMSEDEVKELAARIKKEMAEADAARERAANQPAKLTASLPQVSQTGALGTTASNFFAYDDREVKKGLREFERKWGNISLSDDWRRSHDASFDGLQSEEIVDGGNVVAPISNTEIEEIFQNVPKSETELAAANKKIEDALFELGRLFRSELENPEKSVEALEEMLTRYPDTEHALDAYYLQYVSYTDLGNASKATFYAEKINSLFGDSEYAKFINNPSYLANLKSEEQKVEDVYQRAHKLYDQGAYNDAFRVLRDAANDLGTKHVLQSKFVLLSAMCVGRTKGREPYVNALKELIAKYPNTEEEERAKEIIRLLGIRFTETSEGIEEINPDSYFELGPNDKVHMILVALKKSDGETQNKALTSVSDYNKKYHRLEDIKMSTISLDDENGPPTPLLVLRKFDTREKAMGYYDGVQKNLKDFIPDPNAYEIFAASQRNYRNVVQLKSVDLYRTFFVKEYLSK